MDAIFTSLLGKLVNRRVVPPTPEGSRAFVGEEDVLELTAETAVQEAAGAPLALFIEYRDAKGAMSARRIACKRYEPNHDMLFAFCFERKGWRRFKIDRIVSAACARTGEVYTIEALREALGVAGLANGRPSGDVRMHRIVTVLVFLMLCDREAHPLELTVIEEAASSFALRFEGDDSTVTDAMRLATRIAPDAHDFVDSLRWLANQPERAALARLLDRFAETMVVADGRITSEEAYFAGMLQDALQRMQQAH